MTAATTTTTAATTASIRGQVSMAPRPNCSTLALLVVLLELLRQVCRPHASTHTGSFGARIRKDGVQALPPPKPPPVLRLAVVQGRPIARFRTAVHGANVACFEGVLRLGLVVVGVAALLRVLRRRLLLFLSGGSC